jgi:hypothetical protein
VTKFNRINTSELADLLRKNPNKSINLGVKLSNITIESTSGSVEFKDNVLYLVVDVDYLEYDANSQRILES